MKLNPLAFFENAHYMAEGMLCIILVIGVIIGATVLLSKLSSKK